MYPIARRSSCSGLGCKHKRPKTAQWVSLARHIGQPEGRLSQFEERMERIDILLTGELGGGFAPFRHGNFDVFMHRWLTPPELPLVDGPLWAFIDWNLPEMSGLELCRRLRCDPATASAHLTMVLSTDDWGERSRALRTGADDYNVGPLTRSALLDRVLSGDVIMRSGASRRHVAFGDLIIDLTAFQARWKGKAIALMPNEFRLLRYFVNHPGRVFTRMQLIGALGKQVPAIDERTVDVWIGRLRRALKSVGAGNPLRTVRSLGYVFDGV